MNTQETTPRSRLVEARMQRKLSQREVANHLNTTLVNVSRWERGVTRPGPYFRHKLCELFRRSEEELDLLPTPDEQEASITPTAAATVTAPTPAQTGESAPIYDWTIPRPAASPLIGRDEELSITRQRLIHGGSVALTALNGLPGVGKTALTIALAHDPTIRAHFRDGVLWAALGPEPQIPVLLSHWGKLLGLSEAQMTALSTPGAWGDALREAIGRRSLLLVIDDAWTLEAAQIFMIGGPACAHLVTTRFPHIASHITIDGAHTLRELNTEQGMDLLRQLAPQVVGLEEGRALDLVEAVGGLPLALTLMGNYLRKQGYTGQARRIQAALQRLSDARERLNLSEQRAPVEKHPSLSTGETQISLQSVIAVTDQFLTPRQRSALRTLAVFPPRPNSFSEEAALVVAACDYDMLDALNDTGLLESSGSGRYTLHQTIADYAYLRLDEASADAAYSRLIDYVTVYVENHRKNSELLDLESTTILAALDAAHRLAKQPELLRAVMAFAPFMLLRAWYDQVETHVQRAREAALALGDPHGIINALLYLGQMAQKQSNYAQAEEHYQQGLSLARQEANTEGICALLTGLGEIAQSLGNYPQAEAYFQEGLSLARQEANAERICALLTGLGNVKWKRGEYAQAEAHLLEGLTLARQIGNSERTYSLLRILGSLAASQGEFAKSEIYLKEGLTLARQSRDREQLCILLMNLGVTVGVQGHFSEAEFYF
ncbi:MAG: tetratricopeptide repeat protein, partial [Ktedonobacteraceae bacterium]|nr:tetratricopeptide repeat protein [Ktedonobacteraceae bacterium]